jgi:hypothetical protein
MTNDPRSEGEDMKIASTRSLALAFAGCALALAGCSSSDTSAPASASTPGGATNESAASPKKTMSMMMGCADKDATHVVVADTPVFVGPPGQGAVPVAMVKSGTKVLCMMPGAEYSKCMVADGKAVYIKTAMIKPTTN